MRTDDAELFSLFGTHLSVYSGKDFLVSGFHSLGSETRNIRDLYRWIFKNPCGDCGSGLSKHIREHIIQLNVGDGQAVLRTVFLTGGETGEFPTITHQVPKLANICRRDKTPGNKVVLKDVGNPLGVSLICFLAPYRFHILGASEDNAAGGFQNVVNGNPILPSGFHAHIFAVVFSQPSRAPAQISGKGGKPLALVGCHSVTIGSGDTSNHKRFVDIHPAADWKNDFEHNTSPRNDN